MMFSILKKTRTGMGFVVQELFDNVLLCPTSKIAREVAKTIGRTCFTLNGFVVN